MSQKREAAIVGIHEYPSRDVENQVSALQIKAASAARALEDAGLTWADVAMDTTLAAYRVRREMETLFAPKAAAKAA